ncbi:MAG: FKBP-type peptidyl-prolyl cis-trans isomerase [Ketobacteraceae bacterium]|nr:FKBP-type peptidyl-prolyl cis-trans isomerase [Ketobacteraceae bacterium]
MSDKYQGMKEQACYGIGYQTGHQLSQQQFEGFSVEALLDGLTDALNGQPPQVNPDDINAAFKMINEQLQKEQQEKAESLSAEGEKFLADNAKRDEVTVTGSGLQYEVLQEGTGEKPVATSTVSTHYHGTLIDGTVFDSSYERGQPAEFPVNGVIAGWTEALQMMPVGSKWRLYVPYNLAYGERGAGGAIGPYQTLIFDVELLEIK